MQLELIPSGTFRLEKQDYLNFRCSVAPEKFSSGTNKKVGYHLLSNQIFWNLWEVRILCFVTMLLFNSLGTLWFRWVKWKIINQSINQWISTVKPPVSDHPKCKGSVITHKNWPTGRLFLEETWTHLQFGREFITCILWVMK